ncbi:MAG: hypothetical protein MR872_05630, partial [Clostridium sp.]|nr:hypothetical protein [Clostridium sp.]
MTIVLFICTPINVVWFFYYTIFAGDHQAFLHCRKGKAVKASSIGDTFPLKRAVKGRCGDFRSKAKKILPDLDCGSL